MPFDIRFGLVDAVRIIDHHNIGSLSGGRPAHRGGKLVPRTVILEPALLVLIGSKLMAVATSLLLVPI